MVSGFGHCLLAFYRQFCPTVEAIQFALLRAVFTLPRSKDGLVVADFHFPPLVRGIEMYWSSIVVETK